MLRQWQFLAAGYFFPCPVTGISGKAHLISHLTPHCFSWGWTADSLLGLISATLMTAKMLWLQYSHSCMCATAFPITALLLAPHVLACVNYTSGIKNPFPPGNSSAEGWFSQPGPGSCSNIWHRELPLFSMCSVVSETLFLEAAWILDICIAVLCLTHHYQLKTKLLNVGKLSSTVLINAWDTWTGKSLPEPNKLPNTSDTLLQLLFGSMWKIRSKGTPVDSQKTCTQHFTTLVPQPQIKVEIRKKNHMHIDNPWVKSCGVCHWSSQEPWRGLKDTQHSWRFDT